MLGNNLGAQQALVGKLSDGQLAQELQTPSGVAPTYLIMSELQKRQSMRADAGPAAPPKPNVRQQMLGMAQEQAPQQGPVMSNGPSMPPSQMPVTQRGPQAPLMAPLNPSLAPFSSAPGPHPLPGYATGGLVQHFDNGGNVQPVNSTPNYSGIPAAYMPYIASGQLRPQDIVAATQGSIGEDSNPMGQGAVAGVMMNRALANRQNLYDVVSAPSQFDGYNPTTRAIPTTDPRFQAAALNILPVITGQVDPSGGAKNFLNPALMNGNLPAWAQGSGYKIGGNTFYGGNPSTAMGDSIPETPLPDPTQAANNAGQIMAQYMHQAPPVQTMDQNVANVQGQVSDPSGAYGNLTDTLQKQIAQQGQMGKWNALMQAGAAMMQAKGSNMMSGLGAGLEAGGASYQQAQANQRALQLALANAQVGQAQEHSRYQQGNVQNAMELGKLQSQQQAPYLQMGDTAAKVYGQVQGEDIGAQTARQQHADMMQIYSGRMNQSGQNADTRALAPLNDALVKSASAMDAKTPAGMARTAAIQQQIAAMSGGAGVAPQGGAVNGGGGVPVNSADPLGLRSK